MSNSIQIIQLQNLALAFIPALVAVRYQIVVMCMIFGASGISTACYLAWARHTPQPIMLSPTGH